MTRGEPNKFASVGLMVCRGGDLEELKEIIVGDLEGLMLCELKVRSGDCFRYGLLEVFRVWRGSEV